MIELSEEAKAARREYHKKWRAANKDKVKAINERYWEKHRTERANAQPEIQSVPTDVTIAQIRSLMKASGESMSKLALAIDIGTRKISNYLTGRTRIPYSVICLIANHYNVSTDVFRPSSRGAEAACKFCTHDDAIWETHGFGDDGGFNLTTGITTENLEITTYYGRGENGVDLWNDAVPILFCPFCGRRLKDA